MAATTTVRMAWRNLGRNRRRMLLGVGAIALGQFAFLAIAALMHGYMDLFLDSVTGPLVGHIQIHAPAWRDERAIDLTLAEATSAVVQVRADPNVAHSAPRLFAPALVAESEEGFMAMVVGIDPAAESHPAGLLGFPSAPGGASAPALPPLGARQVYVGRGLARQHALVPGMEIAVVGQDADGSIANDLFTIGAVLPSTLEVVERLGIVMTLADAQTFLCLPDQVHEILVHTRDPGELAATVTRLRALPALAGAEVLAWQEIVPHIEMLIEMIDVYLLILLLIVLVAAAAGIANTMLMATYERTHEFGMLLSLGCGPGRLARLVGVEAIILGQIGVLVGTALGFGLLALTAGSGIDYAALGGNEGAIDVAYEGIQFSARIFLRLYARDILTGAAAVFLTSLVASVWPMIHLARLEPMEAMRA